MVLASDSAVVTRQVEAAHAVASDKHHAALQAAQTQLAAQKAEADASGVAAEKALVGAFSSLMPRLPADSC